MAILKIKQPNGSWAIVGDTSETIKFTKQQLTEEQKQIARENIGAKAEVEKFIEIESPDDFIFDPQTMTWNINPFGSFILTKDYPGTQLPGGDSMMHTCQYFKGDIVRNEIIGSSTAEDGTPYNFKQTIYHSTMPMEHYRYWRLTSGWTYWDYTVHGPKPIGANGVVGQMVGLTIDTTDPAGGFVQLSYCSTDKAVDHYGKTHFVSYDKEQQLTEAQKTQARENIGAKAEVEEFIEITTPDVFVFDVDTMTWTHDPLKSYILTESNWPELEEGGWNTHQCTYTVGDIVRGEIIGIEEYEGK